MAARDTSRIHQNLIDEDGPRSSPPMLVRKLHENALTSEQVQDFLAIENAPPSRTIHIGVAGGYTESSRALTVLALANGSEIMFVQLGAPRRKKSEAATAACGLQILEREIFCNTQCTTYAFNMGSLALSLYRDHAIKISNGVDVQDVCDKNSRSPLTAIEFAIGDRGLVHKENVNATFRNSVWDSQTGARTMNHFALQAWIARHLQTFSDMEETFRIAVRIDTCDKPAEEMDHLAQMVRGDQKIAAQSMGTTQHGFFTTYTRGRNVHMNSTQYTSRIQRSKNLAVLVRDEATGTEYLTHGRTTGFKGREARLEATSSLDGRQVLSVISNDEHRSTNADIQKERTILATLQSKVSIFTNPFLQYIFLPSSEITWPDPLESAFKDPPIMTSRPLNESQMLAVEHMLSSDPDKHITMIQGPPGTGKTTVIATYVQSAIASGHSGIWLIAQTNVAVKNIAEKLADSGFMDWRLLVSSEFHDGWHEHLYLKLNQNTVPSSQFPTAVKQLGTCQVLLCTLSMLSNPRIDLFTNKVPIRSLVVDEASQIALSDYLHPLSSLGSLSKLLFIGDDKQLPPFGQDEEKTVQSVFDKPHLQESAILLNTQYRMPPQIGDFISDSVYNGQLQSNPEHPITSRVTACYFVDTDGSEKPSGTSFINPEECVAVQKIAAQLEIQFKKYTVITPYEAQKNALKDALKAAGLNGKDKCFNVDSFQGNEEDYIIISLVRSEAIGFLSDLRRTNVMLSRCKKGMFICSSWNFLDGIGKETLVGQMASFCGEKAWIGMEYLEQGIF